MQHSPIEKKIAFRYMDIFIYIYTLCMDACFAHCVCESIRGEPTTDTKSDLMIQVEL